MVSKNNHKLISEKNRKNEKQRFALRKLNVGVASVLLGITFSVYGGGQMVAHADTTTQGEGNEVSQGQVTDAKTTVTVNEGNEHVLKDTAVQPSSEEATIATNNLSASVASETPVGTETDKANSASITAGEETKKSETENVSVSDLLGNGPVDPQTLAESKVVDNEAGTVTVDNAQDFYDAITKGKATTIIVNGDFTLKDAKGSGSTLSGDQSRNITIKSADGTKHKVDFSGTYWIMKNINEVSMSDLDVYGTTYWGLFKNAKTYNFNNVNYTGSQLVWSNTVDTTINFSGNNNIQTVPNYTFMDAAGKEITGKPQGSQQILELTSSKNTVNFKPGTTTLTTENGNVIQMKSGSSTVNVEDGAIVSLVPQGNGGEGAGGNNYGIVASTSTVNVKKGGQLNVKADTTKGDVGGLYLDSGSKINVDGDLKVTQNGKLNSGNAQPVHIGTGATVTVTNGGNFEVDGSNLGNSNGALISTSGNFQLDAHSNFKVTGDGTGNIQGVLLGSGKFTSDQPESFVIDLSQNKNDNSLAVKNGTIDFTRVKSGQPGEGNTNKPLGKVSVKYDSTGKITSSTITSEEAQATNDIYNALNNDKKKVEFTLAGQDVTLSDLHLNKNNVLTGKTSSAASDSNSPIYVTVKVGDEVVSVPTGGNYKVYTKINADEPESKDVKYVAKNEATGGSFSINLSQYITSTTPGTTSVTVTASKDFVENSATKSVDELRALNTKTLEELTADEAVSAKKQEPAYYNDSKNQAAYDKAITNGKDVLEKAKKGQVEQEDVNAAVEAIQTAISNLKGQANNTSALETAITGANTAKKTDNYNKADGDKKTAVDDALELAKAVKNGTKHSDGTDVTDDKPVTQADINAAKEALENAVSGLNGNANSLASAKRTANTDITNAATAAKEAIDNLPTLTKDEKDAAKAKINEDAKKAASKVRDATSVTDVNKAVSNGVTAINNDLKETAKADIDAAKTAKDAEIDKSKLTDAEKTAAKEATKKEADKAKTAVDNAKTDNGAVDPAKVVTAAKNGKTNIDNVSTVSTHDLEEATKDDTVNGVKTSSPYKDADNKAKGAYDAAVQKGKDLLDKTKNPNPTQDDIDKAVEAIKNAKTGLQTSADKKKLADAKSTANNAIDAAAEKAKKDIEDSETLTDAEKTAAIGKINTDVTKAKDAVTNATTPTDVKTASDKGIKEIKKEVSKANLDHAVNTEAPANKKKPAYYNADKSVKDPYDQAVSDGADVLANPDATQEQIDAAVEKINSAANNLKGQPNDTSALEKAITDANTAKGTDNYNKADADKKTAVVNALELAKAVKNGTKHSDGTDVTDDKPVTQADINAAKEALENAVSGLNGNDNNLASAKEAAKAAIEKAKNDKKAEN